MVHVIAAALALLLSPGEVPAQAADSRPAAGVNEQTGAPGSAGPKDGVAQHGGQPNPAEVRPSSEDGDQPSASAGELRPREVQRVFGLPVTTALVIAAVIVVLVAIAGFIVPETRRRARARGNGTYGRPR